MPLEPGLLLGGRYCLERRLAGGGTGAVWVAPVTARFLVRRVHRLPDGGGRAEVAEVGLLG